MANIPEAYIGFEVYEDKTNFLGISKATLPNINFLTQTINGAGIAGNIEAVLQGMLDAMTLQLDFRTPTDAAVSLMAPKRHNIDLRVAEQYWNNTAVQSGVTANKFVMIVLPKNTSPGSVAPAAASDASGEYVVYYYAGYRDGKKLWEIDQLNFKCEIGGVDYTAQVKKALGK